MLRKQVIILFRGQTLPSSGYHLIFGHGRCWIALGFLAWAVFETPLYTRTESVEERWKNLARQNRSNPNKKMSIFKRKRVSARQNRSKWRREWKILLRLCCTDPFADQPILASEVAFFVHFETGFRALKIYDPFLKINMGLISTIPSWNQHVFINMMDVPIINASLLRGCLCIH